MIFERFSSKPALELLALGAHALGGCFQRGVGFLVLEPDLEPLLARQFVEVVRGDPRARLELAGARALQPCREHGAHAREEVLLEDALLVVEVLAHLLDLGLLDRERAAVLLDAVAREYAHVDHGTVHAGRDAQRRVLNVGRLLAEDRPKQLLFRRQLRLALRRDLADQDVARIDLGADEGDAGLVELGERRFADVRDVGGDLLRPELGVARDAGEFLDVDRREAVLLDHPLRDQDRVLEVVAVPRHERDQQVLAEREFAQVRSTGRRPARRRCAITSPAFTSGRWLMQVFWFDRVYFVRL